MGFDIIEVPNPECKTELLKKGCSSMSNFAPLSAEGFVVQHSVVVSPMYDSSTGCMLSLQGFQKRFCKYFWHVLVSAYG